MNMDTKMECPFCGKQTTYGETIMSSGHTGCPNCYWEKPHGLGYIVPYLKEHNYGAYISGQFYKNGYEWCKDNFENIDKWR